jgi:hypothetical protein
VNREQRRHPEKLRGKPDDTPSKIPADELGGHDRGQDDLSVRAKSSGHGKKTADKWNQ